MTVSIRQHRAATASNITRVDSLTHDMQNTHRVLTLIGAISEEVGGRVKINKDRFAQLDIFSRPLLGRLKWVLTGK